MTYLNVNQWVTDRLTNSSARMLAPNALVATFQLGVVRTIALGITKELHEEPITSSLLGTFASYSDICSDAFVAAGGSCSWQYVSKYGSGELSERATGADFALVVHCEGCMPRLAIFQAKATASKGGSFKVHQEAGCNAGVPMSQFERLRDHALKLGAQLSNRAMLFVDLHWVHFLIYGDDWMRCIQLNQLEDVQARYTAMTADLELMPPGLVKLHTAGWTAFFWLLTRGATPSSSVGDLTGWLVIQPDEIKTVQASLLNFMDVYVARQHLGPALSNDPNSKDPRPSHRQAMTNTLDKISLEEKGGPRRGNDGPSAATRSKNQRGI